MLRTSLHNCAVSSIYFAITGICIIIEPITDAEDCGLCKKQPSEHATLLQRLPNVRQTGQGQEDYAASDHTALPICIRWQQGFLGFLGVAPDAGLTI